MVSATRPKPILSIRDVAEECQVPESTVREWVRKGLLPHIRQGNRRLWITRVALERFLGQADEAA